MTGVFSFIFFLIFEQIIYATGNMGLLKTLFFGGGQNIKKREVFAAARLDVEPFSCYLFFIFQLFCKMRHSTH